MALSTERRLRYAPFRPVGDGWSFRLHVERLCPDGEWEPLATADLDVESSDAFSNPDRFIQFERRTAALAGLDRNVLPIVGEPCPLISNRLRESA